MKNKILIIDDDPAILDLFKIVIDEEIAHITADFAASLEEASEKIESETYQAIISEFYFQTGNVLPLYHANREAKNIPIAFLSDDYPDYVRGRFVDEQVPMHEVLELKILLKPCGVDELIDWIREIVAATCDRERESR